MNFEQLLPRWKQAMENGYIDNHPFSPLTVADYLRRVSLFLAEYENLNYITVKTALRAIPTRNHGKYAKLYKAIVCLCKFLDDEGEPVDSRLVVKNKQVPPELVKLQRKAIHQPKQLTVSESDLARLKQHCQTPFELLVVTLLSSTGLRASEACALTLATCNRAAGHALVLCGKGRKPRKVPLSPRLLEAIDGHLRTRDPRLTSADPLLSHDWAKPIKRTDLNAILNAIGERAGVRVTPHALRRAFVTISHAKGVPLDHARIVCGHSDIKTTMGYCRTQEADALESVRKLDF